MFNLFDRKTCMMRSASGNCKPAHRLCESVHRTTCNELRRVYCLGIDDALDRIEQSFDACKRSRV